MMSAVLPQTLWLSSGRRRSRSPKDIFQELFPVPLASIDIHTRVSAIHHVIESTRKFDS